MSVNLIIRSQFQDIFYDDNRETSNYVSDDKLFIKFPAGEIQCVGGNWITCNKTTKFLMICNFRSSDDIIKLLMLYDSLKRVSASTPIDLLIPYFPAARQDRSVLTESFGLQVYANIIKTLKINSIVVDDPHSDVLAGMFPAGVLQIRKQVDLFMESNVSHWISPVTILVAPDNGAVKKIEEIYKQMKENIAKDIDLRIVYGTKTRNYQTGKIMSYSLPLLFDNISDVDKISIIVIDDIVDGGATFVEIGKEIERQMHANNVSANVRKILHTTHGIYSKGKDLLLEYYNTLSCTNDMSS